MDFDISIEEAKKIIAEDKEEYVIPLKIIVPDKTLSDLGKKHSQINLSNIQQYLIQVTETEVTI